MTTTTTTTTTALLTAASTFDSAQSTTTASTTTSLRHGRRDWMLALLATHQPPNSNGVRITQPPRPHERFTRISQPTTTVMEPLRCQPVTPAVRPRPGRLSSTTAIPSAYNGASQPKVDSGHGQHGACAGSKRRQGAYTLWHGGTNGILTRTTRGCRRFHPFLFSPTPADSLFAPSHLIPSGRRRALRKKHNSRQWRRHGSLGTYRTRSHTSCARIAARGDRTRPGWAAKPTECQRRGWATRQTAASRGQLIDALRVWARAVLSSPPSSYAAVQSI
ncbi:hypothetical protein BJ912DRAFT_1067307 [Pholiota molesta]|nr:hypothetical protein BJ912DRAFT_1067307 [Pholiota molesta]